MDAAIKVLAEWIAHPALWAAAVAIGIVVEVVKAFVRAKPGDRGAKGVYLLSLPLHPLVLGAAVGLIPGLPAPASFGVETAGRVLFYLSAACVSALGYRVIAKRLPEALEYFGGRIGGSKT